MHSAAQLIRLNTEIENQFNADGDLVPLPGKDSALFVISLHQAGAVTSFRCDIPPAIRERVLALGVRAALEDHSTVKRILSRNTPCEHVFAGKGYYFAHTPAPDEFPDAEYHEDCFVVRVNGEPVSWAWTQDGNENASELAVETLPAYRRQGYARQVVAAWASHEVGAGRVAFYSHTVDNVASEALARSLGAVRYAIVSTYS